MSDEISPDIAMIFNRATASADSTDKVNVAKLIISKGAISHFQEARREPWRPANHL